MSAPAIEGSNYFTGASAGLVNVLDRDICRNGAQVWRRKIAGLIVLTSASNQFACQEHLDLDRRFEKQCCAGVRGSGPLKRRMQDDALRPLFAHRWRANKSLNLA